MGHRCDSLPAMKTAVARFAEQLSSDPEYFKKVYQYTFDLGRTEGARSLGRFSSAGINLWTYTPHNAGMDSAQAFWSLLIPYGLDGGALSHIPSTDSDHDVDMGAEGWKSEYTRWWFDFLNEKGGKGVSKDTWNMVRFCSFFIIIHTQNLYSSLSLFVELM